MSAGRSTDPIVWIDCEMTGLDRENDTIMSFCCFITDADLNLMDEQGYEATIHHDRDALDSMSEWCIQTHGNSGLTEACLQSTTTAETAAADLLNYIKQYVSSPQLGLLAGNSVHCDKEFLRKSPYGKVLDYLSHRILDVSSIKEAAKRWATDDILQRMPPKKGLHQAREDILESIEEAKYYRSVFFAA